MFNSEEKEELRSICNDHIAVLEDAKVNIRSYWLEALALDSSINLNPPSTKQIACRFNREIKQLRDLKANPNRLYALFPFDIKPILHIVIMNGDISNPHILSIVKKLSFYATYTTDTVLN